MNILLVVLVFLFVSFVVVAAGSIIAQRRGQVKDRLSNIQKMTADADPEEMLRLPFLQRVIAPAWRGISHAVGNIAPREIRSRLEKRIMHAGTPWNLNFYSLVTLQLMGGGAFFLLAMLMLRVIDFTGVRMVLFVLFITFIGFYLPYGVVNSKADTRQHQIRRALPDALDLLLISVEAGLGFDMALKRVSTQMAGPLSEEFKKALDEVRMGSTREAALRGIAKRCGVNELNTFISAVIQSEQLGSNIANTLKVQADYMRQRRRQLAEEMAMKAPVKLVFPLIVFIFPSLFVVIMGPAVIRIFQTLIGGF